MTVDGFRAGAAHAISNLIAGGLALSLESDVPQGATVMSAFAPSSFAGLASSLVVWLLSGGTLALHHPFDGEVLEQQINEHSCETLIAPAQLALRLAEIDLAVASADPAQCDRSVARAGTGRIESASGPTEQATLTDVYLFGEAGLFGARRAADGAPAPDPAGTAWRAARSSGLVDRRRNLADAEGDAGLAGTDGCAVRPMRPPPPRKRLSDGASRRAILSIPTMPRGSTVRPARSALPRRPRASWRSAATGSCRRTCRNGRRRLGQGALLTALPDRLSGHRLAGRAQDNARAREALAELGLNPLMVEAFRDRADPD